MAASRIKFFISTYDVSESVATPRQFKDRIVSVAHRALRSGARVVLFPEYSSCALFKVIENGKRWSLRQTAEYIWREITPELQALTKRYGAIVFAGTGPHYAAKSSRPTNKALLWADGRLIDYSKVKRTPWEEGFNSGRGVKTFKWRGLKVAPMICYDIEFPELAASLKRTGVDLILCPSATSDVLGSERVHRCASARAVELGAVVLVSALLGRDIKNELVDINVGRLAAYYPSQEVFRSIPKVDSKKIYKSGRRSLTGVIDVKSLAKIKARHPRSMETRPFLK